MPYEVTFYTGDVSHAGTDASIILHVFGEHGSSCEQRIEKKGDRFERARADLVKLELDDIAPVKKIRVEMEHHKIERPDWFLEKVCLRTSSYKQYGNANSLSLQEFDCASMFI